MERYEIYTTVELDPISSAILNALDTHIAIIDPTGNVVAFNTQWKIFREETQENWSHPALEANILKSLQTPLAEGNDFALRLLLGIKNVLSGETKTFETKHFLNDHGKHQWFKVAVKSLGDGQGAVLVFDDISSQIQSTKYLKETQQKFESHFQNSLYGILVTDENHAVIEANNEACKILETTTRAIIFSDISNYLDISLDTPQIQKKINREGHFLGEREILTANGNALPIELSVNLFRNENGEQITSWAFKDISDKKTAELALKSTEQQYKLQFNNTLEGTIIGRPNGQILLVNPAACDMLGYTADELEGQYRDIIFDSNHPINKKALEKRREDGSFTGEVEFTHKDGRKISVEISSVIFKAEDGTEKTIINVKDISARKAIEQQLIEEKEFTESAISSLPTAFFVFNTNGDMLRWNNLLETDLGYTARELAVSNVMDLIHIEDRPMLDTILKGEFKGERVSAEIRCLAKDGQTVHYLISGTSFKQNGETYIVGGGLNRNDLKEIESEKNKNSKLLNQLFFNSPVGIALVNADGTVKSVNKSFENIFGYTQCDIQGKELNKTIVPENMDKQGKALSHLSFTGDSFQTEALRINKQGKEVPVLVGGVPVEIDGEIIAIYGMYVDISERKELENQIIGLLETEKKARLHMEDMFEEAPSAIAMLEGENHKFTFVNETYRTLVGKTDLIGRSVEEVLPELTRQGFIQLLDECYSEGKPVFFNEKEVYFKKGEELETHYLNFVYKPLRDENGQVYDIFVQAIDVTEQVEARNIIENSLTEKNILLGEVHHRVKNNLAIISGLLELDLMASDNKEVIKHLTSTQSRITSIAKIHELLYKNESLSHVNFKNYLESMSGSEAINDSSIFKEYVLDDIILNVNQAIPAGMLLNEIINTLKEINSKVYGDGTAGYTFELREDGETVLIKIIEGERELLSYFENAKDSKESLHFELIDVLLKQIHGNMKITKDKHSTLSVSFAKRELKGPHNALNN
ncbi:MAG: PAS domain S-box protein [Gracilimonas sp.]